MSAHSFVEKHWVKRSILSYIFLPVAFLFSLILRFRRCLYTYKIFRSYKAVAFIISVGNLTVGGNGKTPFTILLAHILKNEGFKVVVSHRGYKGMYENTVKLISNEDGMLEEAYNAGDEPLLLAQNLNGIPVVVGKNRKAAIRFVQEKYSPDVIILDDSFQHLKVKHDYDFLLFNGRNPLGNGFMTPSGMLREPARSMRFADCFVFNDISEGYRIPKLFKKYSLPFISTSYQIKCLMGFNNEKEIELSSIKGKKVLLVSGIGNPISFEESMKKCGVDIVRHMKFGDHHDYTDNDVHEILEGSKRSDAEMIITTEKDFVKIKKHKADISTLFYAKLDVIINEMDMFHGIVNSLKKEI